MSSPTPMSLLSQHTMEVGPSQGLPRSLSFLFSEAAPLPGSNNLVPSPKSLCGPFNPFSDCVAPGLAVSEPTLHFSLSTSFVLDSTDDLLMSPSLLSPAALEFFDNADSLNLEDFMKTSVGTVTDHQLPDDASCLPQFDFAVCDAPSPTPSNVSSLSTATGGLRRRRPKVPVAEDVKKTEKYIQRRAKNNLAAARNREMKRQMAAQAGSMLPELTKKNVDLRNECGLLRSELTDLLAQLRQRLGR